MTADLYLFKTALKDLARPKRVLPALALVAMPAALVALVRTFQHGANAQSADYNFVVSFLVYGFVLVILAVIFAAGVISQEIEQKTIVYLLTRPMPRWRILLAKFAAALLAVIAATALALFLVALAAYGPHGIGQSPLKRDLLIVPVGALAYGSLFLMLAALINRALLVGLLFAFGWETWVPNMPGSFQKLSLMTYLRVLAPHSMPESESIEVTKLLSVFAPESISDGYAWRALVIVIGLALTAAIVAFSRREYVPRDDAD